MDIGYDQPLYILPFDHRSSFEKSLFGWKAPLTQEQTGRIAASKRVIYDAFRLAVQQEGGDKRAGILVDEQFGAAILRDARANGFITCLPAEKSGQEEFEFEYGDAYGEHIEAFDPTFVKVLVRYNPESDEQMNRRQAARLKQLGEYVHAHGRRFMFELLVPMTHEQSDRLEGDLHLYDHDLRPSLMIAAIKELQNAGVEPDVWKIEGLDRRDDCAEIVKPPGATAATRWAASFWAAAPTPSRFSHGSARPPRFPALSVSRSGRTTFWDPLVALRDGKSSREQAVRAIADKYLEWIGIFEAARAG